MNGTLTVNEDIADIYGNAVAFEGYKLYHRRQGREVDLPLLERFTHDQIFFINLGQVINGMFFRHAPGY